MATTPEESSEIGFSMSTSDEWLGGKDVMLCPFCGCAYIHPSGARAIDDTQIVHEFFCEDGHEFRYLYWFRKGHMIIELQNTVSGGR